MTQYRDVSRTIQKVGRVAVQNQLEMKLENWSCFLASRRIDKDIYTTAEFRIYIQIRTLLRSLQLNLFLS